jgi:hypothetical protein
VRERRNDFSGSCIDDERLRSAPLCRVSFHTRRAASIVRSSCASE